MMPGNPTDAVGIDFVFGNADQFVAPPSFSAGGGGSLGGFSSVPEPSGATECLLGLLALAIRRRNRA